MDNDDVAEYLAGQIRSKLDEDKPDVDIFDIMEDDFVDIRERTLEKLNPDIEELDERFFDDPTNPVINQTYPVVDRSSSTSQTLGFEELGMRSPYTDEEYEILNNTTIGFSGFGGVEIASLGLAREGVGNFILADPDDFDPSNANRQVFCFEDNIGRNKVYAGKDYLNQINSDVSVDAYAEAVTEENVDEMFSNADMIISAVDDFRAREVVNQYGRENEIPVLSTIWGGYEGQYTTFHPEDPDFREVFPYTASREEGETVEEGENRGASGLGINILDSFVAKDAVNIALENDEKAVDYPYVMTVNMDRTLPLVMRDIREIPFEYNM